MPTAPHCPTLALSKHIAIVLITPLKLDSKLSTSKYPSFLLLQLDFPSAVAHISLTIDYDVSVIQELKL